MKMKRFRTTAFALGALAMCACSGSGNENKADAGNDDAQTAAINCIMTRASVREYQDKTVEKDKIEKLLRAGMAAPSAQNRQPWHFVVVDNRAVLDSLAAANPYAGMAAKAPLAIVVCGDISKAIEGPGRNFWIQDTSAATENILLAAHALGLGAVWTGTFPAEERCEAVRRILRLPDSMVPLNTIVIGYPAEDSQPKDKWLPENISYNEFGSKYEL